MIMTEMSDAHIDSSPLFFLRLEIKVDLSISNWKEPDTDTFYMRVYTDR